MTAAVSARRRGQALCERCSRRRETYRRDVPLGFSADETLDVGIDTGTPAADTYTGTFPFTGKIGTVTFNLQ